MIFPSETMINNSRQHRLLISPPPHDDQMLNKADNKSPSPYPLSNRKFFIFCAFLFTLLLGSSLQRTSSYLPTAYDLRGYQRAFSRRRYFSTTSGAGLQARTVDLPHAPAVIRNDAGLYCDRSHHRTDVCVAKGDVRVVGGGAPAGAGYTVLLLAESGEKRVEKVRPYTRKWEKNVMNTIDEVSIIRTMSIRKRRPITIFSKDLNLSRNDQQNSAVQRWSADDHWKPVLQQKVIAVNQTPHAASMDLQQRGRSSNCTRRHKKRSSSTQSDQWIIDHSLAVPLARPDQGGVQADVVKRKRSGARLQVPSDESAPACDLQHEVPGILFSTGGYTGNVYHEFNDGLIPLFITAQQYPAGQVVLLVLEYHDWWITKYAELVAQISNYAVIDLARDKRVHCFPEITVGLHIHNELAIHANHQLHSSTHASMQGFQSMLRAAYLPALVMNRTRKPAPNPLHPAIAKRTPKLVIISRKSPRAILNQKEVITLAKKMGFSVQVLSPTRFTSMAKMYWALNTCDVMMGVHGAAMTHLLFMRPGATLIQVVPLGTDWAAATYYGEPAKMLGLKYVEYKVSPRESSLWERYGRDDPVLVNPDSVNRKGWWETKRIYLEGQDVRISLAKMRVVLRSAYARASLSDPAY